MKDRILLSFLQQEPEDARAVTIKVNEALLNAVYFDEIGGKSYTGEQLRQGITVYTDDSGWNSQMWYLIKQ